MRTGGLEGLRLKLTFLFRDDTSQRIALAIRTTVPRNTFTNNTEARLCRHTSSSLSTTSTSPLEVTMSTEGLMEPVPGVDPTRGGLYLWRYVPNVGAAALFLVLFMASFLYISWKIWRTRAFFCIVFAVGCFSELLVIPFHQRHSFF